jgi:hypothetical protein
MALEPFWLHRGWDSKKHEKKNIGFQQGMKLNLVTNLVLNWVCLIFIFLNVFNELMLLVCVL